MALNTKDEASGLLGFMDVKHLKIGKILPKSYSQINESSNGLVNKLSQLAALCYDNQQYERAIEFLNEAISKFPSPELYSKRSIVHILNGNYLKAASDATCSIGLDSKFPSGYFCRALAAIYLREYEPALLDLSRLRNCLPNSKRSNALFVKCRSMYWEKGIIEPFEPPQDIHQNVFDDEYSIFTDKTIFEKLPDLLTTGLFQSSQLTEEFVTKIIETYTRKAFKLPQKHVFMILKLALDIFKESPNLVSIGITVSQKLTVVGDLRGNFDNLMSIFKQNRSPHFGRHYLFNGNIIGDCEMSLPCIIIILCLKILFPEDVFVARGSEECQEMSEIHGFEQDVLTVYDEDIMKGFSEVFNSLPIAHIVNNSVLIVHGGLFGDEKISLSNIQDVSRIKQPPDDGLLCDILFSDPWNNEGLSREGRVRGIWFGPDVTNRFCSRNLINYVVRSHQVPNIFGYEEQEKQLCITINSSTPYCAYLHISGKTGCPTVRYARKKKTLPNHCHCFLQCKCSTTNTIKNRNVFENKEVLNYAPLFQIAML